MHSHWQTIRVYSTGSGAFLHDGHPQQEEQQQQQDE